MNIIIPHSWLTEYLQTTAKPADIARCLTLCGPSVESLTRVGADYFYDIEITTNRIDTVSIIGIAREAAAILPRFGYKTKLIKPILAKPIKPNKPHPPLEIINQPKLCRRILAVVVEMDIIPSPKSINRRLQKINQRPLLSAIDITNLVTTEIGHPLHVFDYDRIPTHQLIIRESKPGEKITTLDNKTHTLTGGDIVIDDGTGRLIDLPGIIGAKNSVITNNTKQVIIFTETNDPARIRKTSMTHNIHTLAASINEKNVDSELAKTTILRALKIAQEHFHARQLSPLIDLYPHPYQPHKINLAHQFITKHLGVDPKPRLITSSLNALGFQVVAKSNNYSVTVPSWRSVDITLKEDIVEEVARIYGYFNLPSILPPLHPQTGITQLTANHQYRQIRRLSTILKQALVYTGYNETYHISLISRQLIEQCRLDSNFHLKLKNPLSSDWEYLRTSILPSLVSTLEKNQHHQPSLRLFELAKIYLPDKKLPAKEQLQLTLVSNSDSFLKFKGQLENLLGYLNLHHISLTPTSHPMLDPHSSYTISLQRQPIGHLGQLAPTIASSFQLSKPIYAATLDLAAISQIYTDTITFVPISPYATIIHDLTLTGPQKTNYAQISSIIRTSSRLIKSIKLVSLYQNRYTVRISYNHPTKNLTDQTVKPIREKILQDLSKAQIKLWKH